MIDPHVGNYGMQLLLTGWFAIKKKDDGLGFRRGHRPGGPCGVPANLRGLRGDAGDSVCLRRQERTFTPAELAQARSRHDVCQYLAGRFAVKEAVFKAVAPLTQEGFDLREVECLDAPTGQPEVVMDGALSEVYASAGVSSILVSVTNETGYVEAIALAQQSGGSTS